MDKSTYSVLVGGKAGEGVKKAAQVIAAILCAHGKYVVQSDDYQSLIRGGHNFSVVTFADERVFCTYNSCDLIICFDRRSVDEHSSQLKENGLLFYNSDDGSPDIGIPLPLTSLMKRCYNDPINVSLAAVAVFCACSGVSIEFMNSMIADKYKQNTSDNISYTNAIYALINSIIPFLPNSSVTANYNFLSGNQMIALGAWTAGLDFYYGYPMTPASSILHYIALKQESHKMYSIHAESELAAINMAIGSAIAGCRSAVGSSGGGFSLMQEAFSLAGMAEVPLLCILSSRPGPSTGVSTYTAQEDLFFALHQGHGEFPRVVASPDSYERAFSLAAELLSLAWKVQTPVILLTEKHLSEGQCKVDLDNASLPDAEISLPQSKEGYNRYNMTKNGISPLSFPGDDPETVIKWSSHEHTANGLRTDKPSEIVEMKEKRLRKWKFLYDTTKEYQRVAEYGEGESLVFAYGSTVLELREAMKYSVKPFKIIAPIYLEPFPLEELLPYRGKAAIVVEHSSTAAFAEFLKWKLDLKIKKSILKYDGREFDPIDLAVRLEEAFNA